MRRLPALVILISVVVMVLPAIVPVEARGPGAAKAAPEEARPAAQPRVEVFGLSLGRSVPSHQSDPGLPWRFFSSGTNVHIAVLDNDSWWMALDLAASKLTAFTDDKGTVLREPNAALRPAGGMFAPKIEEDRHTFSFYLHSDRLPARGAAAVRVAGQIGLKRGAKEKVATAQIKRARPKEAFRIGPFDITLDVGPGFARDRQQTVHLISRKDLAPIKSLVFLDAEGNVVDNWLKDVSESKDDEGSVYRMGLLLRWRVWDKPLTLKMTYFETTETVVIPFDATVGMGL